jgi:NADPH2:quinone reductase
MRALLINSPGGWEGASIAEVPEPVAGSNEAVVEIHAVGLNPADEHTILGKYPGGPKPPFIIGRDAAGIVVGGNGPPVGTKVVAIQAETRDLANGTLAERQRIPADLLAPLPNGWTMAEGAAAPLAYMTAWRGLTAAGGLHSKHVVLVTGASGGVGCAAVQLAHAAGAKVVALSRSDQKRKRLLEIGADFVFPPDAADLKDQVANAIGRKGVDRVMETVGGAYLGKAVHLLGRGGVVAECGVLAGVEGPVPIPALMFKQATIVGILVSGYSAADSQNAWAEVVETLARSHTKPIVDRIFPWTEYRAAFDALRGGPFGKIVVQLPAASE